MANREKSKMAKSAVIVRCCTSFGASAVIVLAMMFGAPLGGAQEMDPPRLASDKHSDAHIAEAIRQVSAEHIRQTIEKLVSFQNRSTLSAQDEESIKAGKGIGAAREWIRAEFERYSKECGGCLEVKTDAFTEQAGRPHSETDRNHQCLCGATRRRSSTGESHRAGDGPLRFAQQ